MVGKKNVTTSESTQWQCTFWDDTTPPTAVHHSTHKVCSLVHRFCLLCILIFIAALQPLFQATTYFRQTPINSFTILGTLFDRVTLILCKHTHVFFPPISSHFFFFLSPSVPPTHTLRRLYSGRVKPGRRFLMSLTAGSPGPRRHISLYYSWPLGRVR